METIYIKNKVGRIVEVTKSLGLRMIKNGDADFAEKPVKKLDYSKLNKVAIIEILKEAKVEFDETDTKENLLKLITK